MISSWLLIIFGIDLSVTLGEFPSRFSKCSFHSCISSCLAAFSFVLNVVFLLLSSFIVCHSIRDCLSSTKFLILLIWLCMYSCSFLYVLVLSGFSYASAHWHLLGFFYYVRILFSRYVAFFPTTNDSNVTLHLSVGLFGIYSTAAFIFSYSSLGARLSNISWRVLNLFLTLTIYLYLLLISLLVNEDQS